MKEVDLPAVLLGAAWSASVEPKVLGTAVVDPHPPSATVDAASAAIQRVS